MKYPKEGEVILNDPYEVLGLHYSLAIMLIRMRKPKQKSSEENIVRNIATIIIVRLRNKVHFNLGDLQKDVMKVVNKDN